MKKMTLTRRLILSGALVSALAMGLLVLGVGLSVRNTPGPLGDSLSPGIALAAAAADLPGTFDSQLAGLSAYLDLGSPIDLEVVESMSTAVYEKRSTYILIAISGIILYAEQGGWLVAYVARGDTSNVAFWFPQSGTSKPILRSRDQLYTTLESAVDILGLDWTAFNTNVTYTHFNYPSATRMVVFSKGTYSFDREVTFQIPGTSKLHEASWSAYSGYRCCSDINRFSLDGVEVGPPGGTSRDSFLPFSVGSEHKLIIDIRNGTPWMGVAVFLVLE